MTTRSPENPIEVLLVEDNPADARLTEEILKDSAYAVNLSVVEDGEDAMTYLRRQGEYAYTPRPDLVLLDLMLPRKSGQEVLTEINQDPNLRNIPIMILTGTAAEQSILWQHNISPGRFCRKPIEVHRFDSAVSQLDSLSERPLVMATPPAEPQSNRKWWWPFGR